MLDGIIFDVDGTLWDARAQVLWAWNMAKQEKYGEPFEVEFDTFSGLFGKTMDQFAPYIFPNLPQEEALEKSYYVMNAEAGWLMKRPGVVFDGVREMLKTLSETYPLYIVSNCQCGYIEVLLKTGGLEEYITDHMCFGDTETPKGQTIRTLMKKHGMKTAVYVGDTQGDADACIEAEIPFIFTEYGFGEVNDAAVRAKNPADIIRAIAEVEAN